MSEQELQTLLMYLKAIANETRLKILGLISDQERSVREIAELLQLKEPTISHHLSVLTEPGLVTMRAEGNTHFYQLSAEALGHIRRNLFTPERVSSLVRSEVATADQKVLRIFLDGETLKKIPDSLRQRMVILKWLANKFEFGVQYPEREINAIIKRHHEDSATLRRELIVFKFMERDHGVYWRVPEEERLAYIAELRGTKDAMS